MKFNYALISRSLIALLFVVAGIQKLMNFAGTTAYIGSIGVPLPALATALVILVELPVALAFAWGYRTHLAGKILIAFTVLATILVHKDFLGTDMIMILKNIAIIGGIMSVIKCSCGGKCDCDCGSCSTCTAKNA